jgi:hypothetical protein
VENPENKTIAFVRKALLAIFVLAVVGTAAELLLLGHFEGLSQYVPLVLLALSMLVLGWYAVSRNRASLRAFQVLNILFVAGGTLGMYLHYQGNALFEVDMVPGIHGWDLFEKAIGGATPALAPGSLVQLGLVGLVFSFRHPLLLRPINPQIE